MATCELPPASQYECKGRTLVTNDEELAAYLENYKYNSRHNIVRGVRLSGNFSGESLDVKTPCGIVVLAGTTFDYTGDICLAGRELVVAQPNVTIQNAANVELISLNRVVIRENFSANMTGDLSLLSLGSTIDSRSHIRYEANVSANNLILKSLRRSTIGHTSTFNLTGKLSILSNGEDLPTDEAEGISEWSSIWRDTTVNASEIEVISEDQARVANGVNLTANKVTLDGLTCKMGGTSSVTAAQKLGVCFDGSLPTIKLRRAAQYKEVLVGEDVFLDGSRSLYPEGSSFEWRIRRNKEDPTAWETGDLTRTFNFDQAGDYRIFFKITKPDGHYNFAVRRVWVSDPAPSIFPFFKFYLKDSELQLVYEGRTFDGSMITNAYYSTPQGETLDVGRMVLGHVDVIPFESNESLELTLNLENENGETSSFTHTIEPNAANQEPYLPIDFLEYAPLETLFFSNFFFDPYDQLGELAGFALNFGDGESVELEEESFRQTHSYPSAGDYDLSVQVFNVEGESFSKAETITIAGVKDGLSSALPIVDFKIDKASWAPGVRLYIDESISPVSPITSYYWNLGDGQTAYGTEVLHFYDQGAYDVSLTVVTEDGNSNTITREVIVLNDAAMLYGSIDCWNIAPLQIECEVEGLSRDANLSEFLIHFGDSELTEENAEVESISGQLADRRFTHTFDTEGDYTVTFGVITNDGEEFLSTFDVSVGEDQFNSAPIANIQCTQNNLFVDCDAFNSYDPDGYITSYEFSMGDGNSYTGNQVFHGYSSEGTYTVSLTVTDNLGRSSTTTMDINAEISGFHQPVAVLDCSSEGLVITCNGYNSFDPNDETLSYEFYYQDQLVATDSSYQLSVNEVGTYEVGLRVRNESGLINEVVKEVDAAENSEDLIFASLECLRPSLYEISCIGGTTEGVNLTYQWHVDGALSTETDDNVKFSFEELNTRNIQMTVSNGIFTKVLNSVVAQGNVNLTVNFTARLEEDGLVTLDAGETYKDGLAIKSLNWHIDGESEAIITNVPFIKIDLARVNNKEITLSATDEIERVSSTSKLVSLDLSAVLPELEIKHHQEHGRASRDVKFSLTQANKLNLDLFSYTWLIDGNEYTGVKSVDHTFASRGEKSISLIVSNGTISQTIDYTFEIDEVRFDSLLTESAQFGDILQVNISNLDNARDLGVSFSAYGESIDFTDTETDQLFHVMHLPRMGFNSIPVAETYEILVDGSSYTFSVKTSYSTYSTNPAADISNHIATIKNKIENELEDSEFFTAQNLADYLEQFDLFEEQLLASSSDGDALEEIELGLRKAVQRMSEYDSLGRVTEVPLFMKVLDLISNKAYALTTNEVENAAYSCMENLESEYSFHEAKFILSTLSIAGAISSVTSIIGKIPDGASVNPVVAGTIATATIFSLATAMTEFYYVAKFLKTYRTHIPSCLEDTYFPINKQSDLLVMDFSSLPKNSENKYILDAVDWKDITAPVEFARFYSDEISEKGELYKGLKYILKGPTWKNVLESTSNASANASSLKTAYELLETAPISGLQGLNKFVSISGGFLAFIGQINNYQWSQMVEDFESNNLYGASTIVDGKTDIRINSEGPVQIISKTEDTGQGESLYIKAINGTNKLSSSGKLSYRYSSSLLGESGRIVHNGEEIWSESYCDGGEVKKFNNNGGYVQEGVKVAGNVSLQNSVLCGRGLVKAAKGDSNSYRYIYPIVISKSVLKNPTILGVKEISIRDSVINGGIVGDYSNIKKSTISNSVIRYANVSGGSEITGSVLEGLNMPVNQLGYNYYRISVRDGSRIGPDTRLVFDYNYQNANGYTFVSGANTSRVKIRNSRISNEGKSDINLTPVALNENFDYQIKESSITGLNLDVDGTLYLANSTLTGTPASYLKISGDTQIKNNSGVHFSYPTISSLNGTILDEFNIADMEFNLGDNYTLLRSTVGGSGSMLQFIGGNIIDSSIIGFNISLINSGEIVMSQIDRDTTQAERWISGDTNVNNCLVVFTDSDLRSFTCSNSDLNGNKYIGKGVTILNSRNAPTTCSIIGGNIELGDGLKLVDSGLSSVEGKITAYGTWKNSCALNNYDEPVVYWDLDNAYCSGSPDCGSLNLE